MVSPGGTDEPQCLTHSTKTACKTPNYPIIQGFTSLCLHGTFYNMSENIEISYQTDLTPNITIFCKACLLINSEITLSCQVDMCRIFLRDIIVNYCAIRLHNIYITFSNVSLKQTQIQNVPYYSEGGNNQLWFEKSNMSCFEYGYCGLYLTNVSSVKVTFLLSYLSNFILEFFSSQLMLICHETNITFPIVNIYIRSFEYLRIPTIIEFSQVRIIRSRVGKDTSKNIKKNVQSKQRDCFIIFDLTHPQVAIKDSSFNGVHVHIKSKVRKGNCSFSIGHCPHLWDPPLQPIHHSQQSYCLCHCSCLTIKDSAVQAEMVAVETSLDVGNILWMFYDCL